MSLKNKSNNPDSVFFETYGCSANQNNTEIMKGLVKQAGLEITNNEDIADVLVINTCIVKGPTEKKIERRISDLTDEYNKPIIITGCLQELREDKDYLDRGNIYLLGIDNIKNIMNLIKSIYDKKGKDFMDKRKEEKIANAKIPNNKIVGITQISQGCNGYCSYCTTKLAKGKLFSFSQDKIVNSVKSDLDSGSKEIWITSQDNASYGMDKGEADLPEILKRILAIDKRFKLRLGMMNPNNIKIILDELIECYKDGKMFKFLHLPLQSGSDKILERMNRKYNVEEFEKIVKRFRKEFPDSTLSTDIIVGYPGETEEDFNETIEVIKRVKPDYMNISKYWPMKGTKAAREKQIPVSTRKKRAKKLMEVHKKISKEKNSKLKGEEREILIDNEKRGYLLGRDNSYRPVFINKNEGKIGKFSKVKIEKIFTYSLFGKIIS